MGFRYRFERVEVSSSVWDFIAAMGIVTGAVWAVASSMLDAQALCGLLHPMCRLF